MPFGFWETDDAEGSGYTKATRTVGGSTFAEGVCSVAIDLLQVETTARVPAGNAFNLRRRHPLYRHGIQSRRDQVSTTRFFEQDHVGSACAINRVDGIERTDESFFDRLKTFDHEPTPDADAGDWSGFDLSLR